jgi:Putative addiction module component
MTSIARRILEEALALPEPERREVTEALLESMSTESTEAIERAWSEEIDARIARLARGETRVRDGEAALAELDAEFASRPVLL